MKSFWKGFEKRASMTRAPEGPRPASFTNFKPAQGIAPKVTAPPALGAPTKVSLPMTRGHGR